MQSENTPFSSANPELSSIWQELLGALPPGTEPASPSQASHQAMETEEPQQIQGTATPAEAIPALPSDPWSALVQARGTEMIDLSQLHLHMSDQDVEQLLQLMQEDPQ